MALPRDAGLTLIEVMVALAIIGVVTGAAVLGLAGAGSGASAQVEAQRLAARLRLAADDTLVTNRSLALRWDPRGYAFLAWDAGERRWSPATVPALAEPHGLPAGLRLEGERPDTATPIGIDGAGAPIVVSVADRSGAWRVAFDGLTVTVAPGGSP